MTAARTTKIPKSAMNNPTQVAPQFLVVGFGRSFIGVTMRKSAIAVQEISSGIAAAGDRGYNAN